ncbi:hypothetical protein COP2_046904 [Malus domestica]
MVGVKAGAAARSSYHSPPLGISTFPPSPSSFSSFSSFFFFFPFVSVFPAFGSPLRSQLPGKRFPPQFLHLSKTKTGVILTS